MKTLVQLMSEALTQTGLDSTFYTQARGWVNTILEAQSMNSDWPYYAKTNPDQSFVSGQTIYPLPADFKRPNHHVFIIQNNQSSGIIRMVEAAFFEIERQGTSSAMPSCCMINWTYTAGALVPTIVFDAAPNASGSPQYLWRMPYFRAATPVDLTGADDNKIPDFQNQDFLLNELKKYALEHQADDRYTEKAQEGQQVLKNNKYTAQMAKDQKVMLEPTVFKRARRTRNGWMGN